MGSSSCGKSANRSCFRQESFVHVESPRSNGICHLEAALEAADCAILEVSREVELIMRLLRLWSWWRQIGAALRGEMICALGSRA